MRLLPKLRQPESQTQKASLTSALLTLGIFNLGCFTTYAVAMEFRPKSYFGPDIWSYILSGLGVFLYAPIFALGLMGAVYVFSDAVRRMGSISFLARRLVYFFVFSLVALGGFSLLSPISQSSAKWYPLGIALWCALYVPLNLIWQKSVSREVARRQSLNLNS